MIALRAGYNNSWIHRDAGQRGRASMIRDQWARESMLDMDHPDAGRGFMVHLFVNGLYWGVHNLCERQDAAHYATYNGGDEDLLDARNGSDFIDGDAVAWMAMQDVVAEGNWSEIQEVIDVDTYIDYQIMNRYGGNADLKENGNWRAAGGGPFPGGQPEQMAPWKLYSWDGERILESPTSTVSPLDPMGLRATLDGMAEYRIRFADRLQKHFFNGGALTPAPCKARWMKFAASLDRAIIAESARWGDHRRNPPYSRNGEWLAEQDRLCNAYYPVRSANVFSRYESDGFYPATDAPVFLVNGSPQHGGEVSGGGVLSITASSGTIFYTTDGSDPRLEGGAVNPVSTAITSGQTVVLPASSLVRVRVLSGGVWSALDEATFYVESLAAPDDLAIEELHYNPYRATAEEKTAAAALPVPRDFSNSDLFEFIEIRNVSGSAVNLDGVRFQAGVDFTFGNAVLAAGARTVVVKDPEAFAIRYPGVPTAGTFSGNLDNDGERVTLVVNGGDTVHDFAYNDADDWPSRPDGIGSSLEIVDVAYDYNAPSNWRASSEFNGSPGAIGSGPDGRIVINEVLTHTDLPLLDTIELHNTTSGSVEVSGWVLSDSATHFPSFAIPGTTTLVGGDYLVLDEDDFNAPAANPVTAYSGTVAAAPVTVASAGHGLATGDLITISGYGGLGAYTGSFEVTVVNGDAFTIETSFLDDHGTKGTWTPGRPFALNGAYGDQVWLLATNGAGRPVKFIDHVDFDAAFQGEALGRWPNGAGSGTLVTMTANSFGSANSGPVVGPVVISEVMYHPTGPAENDLEFVEILNTGATTEILAHWRLRGGADFDFTSAHDLAPGASLVIVAFDPVTAPSVAATFRATYGIDAGVPLAGPFTDGPLRNDAGSLRLQRPDVPPVGEPDFYPGVTEDEVRYLGTAPWPLSAAGGGDSLQRIDLAGFGNFVSSWMGSPPLPGSLILDYAAWQDAIFGPGMPPGSDPLEDFNGDGIQNLVAFGLSMSPLVYEPEKLPVMAVAGGTVTFTYTKDTLRTGISWQVEVSDDFGSWSPVPDILVGTSGFLETRQASLPIGANQRLFLRLAVTQP